MYVPTMTHLNYCVRQSDSLLITTALETILLKPLRDADNQFMEYTSYSGLCTNETTLASGLWNDHIVQITPSSARLMTKDEHGTLLAEWKPPRNKSISMAKLKESHCLVCYEDDIIVYLEIVLNTFVERRYLHICSRQPIVPYSCSLL